MRRLGAVVGSLMPGGLAAAFCFLGVVRAMDPGTPRSVALFLGWLAGAALVGLMRLFRVASWALPLTGILSGMFLMGIAMGSDSSNEDRGGALFLGAILGLIVGLVEWARVQRVGREQSQA